MEIFLHFQENGESRQITVGDIIRCKDFLYGIRYSGRGICVGWDENIYRVHLKSELRHGKGSDASDLSRSSALFLVLSMELVEVILPEDVSENMRYLGINVKCIRLEPGYKFSRNSERIFFTLHHPMSCLDLGKKNIEIVGHSELPVFWNEKFDENEQTEKAF